MTGTPAIWHLMGAYYNQDWADFYSTDEETVDAFVEESPGYRNELPGEIDWVLAAFADDAELESYLDSQGCEYIPQGVGYRAWLQQIADRVRAATATPER
jgi:hypothetical protein